MPFDVWTCFVGTRLMDRLRTSSHAVESHILWGQGQCEGGLFPPWETAKPPDIHATKQPLQSSLWFPTPPASSGHSDHPSNPPQQKLTTIKVPQSTTTLQSQTWDASSAWSPTGTSWIKGTNLKHRSKKSGCMWNVHHQYLSLARWLQYARLSSCREKMRWSSPTPSNCSFGGQTSNKEIRYTSVCQLQPTAKKQVSNPASRVPCILSWLLLLSPRRAPKPCTTWMCLENIEVGRAWKHASQEGGYHDGNMLVLHLKSSNNSKNDTGKDTKIS